MTTYGEIFVFQDQTHDLFNSLTTQEKVFVYYMFRASLPFNRINAQQHHRYNAEIMDLFEAIYDRKDEIDQALVKDIETYLVYLWTNHGIYFLKSHSDNKVTPAKIGLTQLTEQNLVSALTALSMDPNRYKHLFQTIFDSAFEPNLVVDGSIEKSGGNFYGPGFTNKNHANVPEADRNRINAYFHLDSEGQEIVSYYSANGTYRRELTVVVHWLKKALSHVVKYPDNFDSHFVNSLDLMIQFLETGDEEKFRQHCTEWIRTNSRLDWTMGFIESYHDPMSVRGHGCGEVTIKTMDMERINPILMEMETRLPIKKEYQKTKSDVIMNVSMNRILYAAGDYGPCEIIAAYCLPNYNDIRSQVGSKQIIYKMSSSFASTMNPELVAKLRSPARQAFIDKYDPKDELYDDLWDVQVILHETLGHSSGKLYQHTFKEDENLTICGTTYKPGDTIEVTDETLAELIPVDYQSLEELRAEINALYTSISEMHVLDECGLYKGWLEVLGEAELKKQCVIEMTRHMFRRYLTQPDNMERITGSHARANTVITNYLLNGGGIRITDDVVTVDGAQYHILGIDVCDFEQAFKDTISLLQLVQEIKSTGDTLGCKALFDTYTTSPVSMETARVYRQYMMDIKKKLSGNIKESARVYPNYQPVFDEAGSITDVIIGESMDIFEQNKYYRQLMIQ